MKKLLSIIIPIILGLLAISLICFYYYIRHLPQTIPSDQSGIINSVTFTCSQNKSIQAIFFQNKAELSLSDGRHMLLPQAISASGARYANTDESFVFWNKGDTAFVQEGNTNTYNNCSIPTDTQATTTPTQNNIATSTSLANPASVNCFKVGGNLVIQKRGDGGEYGLCYFEDNRACEEWALFRGDCPIGGMKTTGYDTIDQNYCAWAGGQTYAVANSVCIFKNGTKCSTIDFYNGKCSAN